MFKKSGEAAFETLFRENRNILRAEFYSVHDQNRPDLQKPSLICTGEYPPGSGASGRIIPSPLTVFIFNRIIWTMTGDELFHGKGWSQTKSVRAILACLRRMDEKQNSENNEQVSSGDVSALGVTTRRRGMPYGVLVLRFTGDCDLDGAMLPFAGRVLEVLFSDYLNEIWPQPSDLYNSAFYDIFGKPERNTFPFDMEEIRKTLGGCEDMFFKEVIPGFMKRLPDQLKEMEGNISNRDYPALRRGNHRIKGASATLYLSCLNRSCVEFENLIDNEKFGEIPPAFEKLKEAAERLDSFLSTISTETKKD